MKTLREETRGKARLRLLQTTEGYAGLVVTGGQTAPAIHGDDPNVVWSRLEATAGASGPRYFGYDGARARLLRGFPGGFRDPRFISEERNYKVKARDFLNQELPLERASAAVQADCAVAARAFGRTNLLSAFESARLGDVWKGGSGPDFLRAAAAFTAGEFASALQEMEAIVRPYGPPSWPMMTYLPFFWRPQAHMFLKPRVTLDYAERVGHSFAHVYAAGLKPEVYQSLLSLAEAAEASVADFEPRDRIDVQSYIWVVGAGEAVLVTPQGSSRGV